jgi:hypothetical protein
MKFILSAALLLALIAPVRAEDKPAAGGGTPELPAERQEFKKEIKAEREAFKEKQQEKRKAHREKVKEIRQKAKQERKEKKAAAAEVAPAPAAK